jgi:transposase
MGYVDGDYPLGGTGGSGIVEADETFIGGKDRLGEDDKAIVFGMIERNGDVVTRVVQSRHADVLVPHITKFVDKGARIVTDEWSAYRSLTERHGYKHATVDHGAKEWVRGDFHTNTIESFWANLKRGIKGTYVRVSKKHLPSYLREFEYRHNLRHSPYLMFDCLLAAFPKVRVE